MLSLITIFFYLVLVNWYHYSHHHGYFTDNIFTIVKTCPSPPTPQRPSSPPPYSRPLGFAANFCLNDIKKKAFVVFIPFLYQVSRIPNIERDCFLSKYKWNLLALDIKIVSHRNRIFSIFLFNVQCSLFLKKISSCQISNSKKNHYSFKPKYTKKQGKTNHFLDNLQRTHFCTILGLMQRLLYIIKLLVYIFWLPVQRIVK